MDKYDMQFQLSVTNTLCMVIVCRMIGNFWLFMLTMLVTVIFAHFIAKGK